MGFIGQPRPDKGSAELLLQLQQQSSSEHAQLPDRQLSCRVILHSGCTFFPCRPAPRNRDLRPTVRAGGSGPREQGSSAPPRTVPIYTTPAPLPSTFHTDPPTWKYFGLQTHTPLSTGCKADYWGSDERNLRVRSRVGDFILEESSFCFHPGQVTFSV